MPVHINITKCLNIWCLPLKPVPIPKLAYSSPYHLRYWEAVLLRERPGHIPLHEDEDSPPPECLESVVSVLGLEHAGVGQCVVHGPDPGGDPVAQQHVYAVVTMA